VASFMTEKLRAAAGGIVVAALAFGSLSAPALAQDPRIIPAERYTPNIWIDPDGCEHWAMDDGAEGFMGPRRLRDGSPVCHRSEICGVVPTDTLFATDKWHISAAGRARLRQFFTQANAFGFLIYGHTDSRASDEYNITLSDNRARAVAQVAQEVGARVVDVRGFGERKPKASNATAAGMQANRRVEVYCLR